MLPQTHPFRALQREARAGRSASLVRLFLWLPRILAGASVPLPEPRLVRAATGMTHRAFVRGR